MSTETENPFNTIGSDDEDASEGASRTNYPIAVDEDDVTLQVTHHPPPLGHGRPDDEEAEGHCLLIDGDAAWQDSWDVLHMLIVGYIFLELPLRLGFRWTKGEPVPSELYMTRATDLMIDVAMLVDMISRFFTTYTWHDFYGEEFVVRNQRKIVRHYVRGEFGVDFISCMPFDTIVRLIGIGDSTYGPGWVADHVRVLRLARAARLVKLVALFSDKMVKVAEAVPGLGWLKEWTSMIITIVIMLAWNHFICCFLAWAGSPLHDNPHCDSDGIGYYVKPDSCDTEQGCDTDCVPDNNPDDPVECEYLMPCGWVTRTNQKDIQSQAFLDAYITTYYWAFTIITTIGFGDISGSSTRERFFMVAAMMVGALSFGVIIGRVGAMVQSRSMGRIAYDARFRELQEYMQYRATSQRLRTKVVSYLTTKFPNRTIFDENKILSGLPDKLRVEIQIENYYNAVAAVPFLPTNDIHIRTAICSRLVPMTYMQGEHIIHEGALGREMYLIEHGKVVFVHEYQVEDQVMSAPCPTWASDVGKEKLRDATDKSSRRLAAAIGLSSDLDPSAATPWRNSAHTLFEEGAYFGEIAVLVQVRRTRSALADTFTNLLRLDKDTIDHCALDFPKLRKAVDEFTTKKLEDIIAVESCATQADQLAVKLGYRPGTVCRIVQPCSSLSHNCLWLFCDRGGDVEHWKQILSEHLKLCGNRRQDGAYETHRHFLPGQAPREQEEGQRDLQRSLTSGILAEGQNSLTALETVESDSDKLDAILRRFDEFELSLRRLETNQAKTDRKLIDIRNDMMNN